MCKKIYTPKLINIYSDIFIIPQNIQRLGSYLKLNFVVSFELCEP